MQTATILNLWRDTEKRQLIFAALGGISLLFSFCGWSMGLPFDPAWVAVLFCGIPIIREAVTALIENFDIKADLLVSLGLIAAVAIDQIFAAGEIAFIMSLGSILEERTVAKARRGIQKLVDLTPRTARRMRKGKEEIIPADKVAIGDIIRVLPGESVPVDGVITSGQSALDQSIMTGESLPVDKTVHDEVYSGTINQMGAFDMAAIRTDSDSSLQRMIRLVDAADASRTPIVRIMDRWATWIVMAALFTALGVWLITGEAIRAVTVLVVFCPCSLVLSTPTAIMAAIGRATHFGVLVASGDAMERMARINTVVFDKTGTLTYGKPKIIAVRSILPQMSHQELLALAASLEQGSEHPLGRAIVAYAREKGISLHDMQNFYALPGKGVTAELNNKKIYGGTEALLREQNIFLSDKIKNEVQNYKNTGATVIFFIKDGQLAGLIALADLIRPEAGNTVAVLRNAHIRSILLSGDNPGAAANIAQAAGITNFHATLLPQDKVAIIQGELLKDPDAKICMVGDGVNDAPAMKTALAGIAMGGVGSGITVDAADAVLVHDDLGRVPQLLLLARKTAATIKTNITLALLLNLVTVVLAVGGWMGPVVGALAHNAGALLIVLNSTRLLSYAPEKKHGAKIAAKSKNIKKTC